MTASFNARKMNSTVKRTDGCGYSIEIIIVPTKEHITGTNLFGKLSYHY